MKVKEKLNLVITKYCQCMLAKLIIIIIIIIIQELKNVMDSLRHCEVKVRLKRTFVEKL